MASYLQIFSTFAKIGAFTIGGGYAMIPLVKAEIVKKGWMKEEEFSDIIALSQSAPGLFAVNISIFVGYRLKGTKGSIVATVGSVAPPFLTILIIAMAFSGFQDHPVVSRIFSGIRPVVVALIAVPMLQMARKSNKTWWMWGMSAVTILLVAFLEVSPIYILIVTIVVSYSLVKYRDSRKREDRK